MLLPTSFVLLALSLAPSAFADAPAAPSNNKTVSSGGPIRIDHLPIGFGPGPVIVPSSNCSAAISNLAKNHELNECLGLTRDKYSALNATLGEPGQSIAYQFGDYLGQTLCPAQACKQEALDAAVQQVKGNCSDQLINTSPTKSVVPATEATFISLFLSSYPLQRNISCLANVLTGPPKEHPTAEIQGNGICFVELMKNIEAHTDVVFDSANLIRLKGNDPSLMKEIQDKLAKNGSDVAKKTFCTDCHKVSVRSEAIEQLVYGTLTHLPLRLRLRPLTDGNQLPLRLLRQAQRPHNRRVSQPRSTPHLRVPTRQSCSTHQGIPHQPLRPLLLGRRDAQVRRVAHGLRQYDGERACYAQRARVRVREE